MAGDLNKKDKVNGSGARKSIVIVCIAAAIVIVALIGVIVVLLHSVKTSGGNASQNAVEKEKRSVLVTEDNIDELAQQLTDEDESEGVPLHYVVTMSSTWEFEDGQTASKNAYVKNSESNETDVYFDVVRNDTQETIYQSPVLPLGAELDKIVLDKDLDAGDYECTLTYYLIDDEQNVLTSVNMWLMVKVES